MLAELIRRYSNPRRDNLINKFTISGVDVCRTIDGPLYFDLNGLVRVTQDTRDPIEVTKDWPTTELVIHDHMDDTDLTKPPVPYKWYSLTEVGLKRYLEESPFPRAKVLLGIFNTA